MEYVPATFWETPTNLADPLRTAEILLGGTLQFHHLMDGVGGALRDIRGNFSVQLSYLGPTNLLPTWVWCGSPEKRKRTWLKIVRRPTASAPTHGVGFLA